MKIETLLCICLALILVTLLVVFIIRLATGNSNGCAGSLNCNNDDGLNHCCYKFQNYTVKPLVSDIPGMAPLVNADVANPWGIVCNPGTDELWVAQSLAGCLTLLTTDGAAVLNVHVPPSSNSLSDTGSPSGVVTVPLSLQEENAFLLGTTGPTNTGPAQVITVTQDGLICAYNQNNQSNPSSVTVIKDNSASNAVYKGCAITNAGRFYATNFFNGRIEVYDTKWNLETTLSDSIMLSLGYSPFGILCHDNALYVSFALQSGVDQSVDLSGDGNGFILVYDLNGQLLKRLVSRGVLNSPWGMVVYHKHLFVGNSGDGIVNVFDRCSGRYIGSLLSRCRVPVVVEGLKGLLLNVQHSNLVCQKKCQSCSKGFYFTAGINNGTSGLIGKIQRYR